MNDVTLSHNQAEQGGGLYNHFGAFINRATFNNNRASQDGGGLFNDDVLSLTNVTFSANSADQGGGGIYNVGSIALLNGTLYQNSAETAGGIYAEANSEFTLKYSILQNNGGNCSGENASQGYNVVSDATCNLDGPEDRSETDAQLSDLADHGGFAQTHVPAAGSPAVDIGGTDCAFSDQRGVLRAVDADKNGSLACDSGAVEVVSAGYIGFSQNTYMVNEADGQVVLQVGRWGGDQAVGVGYATRDVSALGGRDYGRSSGNLSWGAGNTGTQTISVPILNDVYEEGDEILEVFLSLPTGGAGLLLDSYKAQVTILANDPGGPKEPKGGVYLPLILR